MADDILQLQKDQKKLESEISNVVGAVSDLTQNVTALSTNVKHIDQSIGVMFKRMDEVRTQKTPWGTLISFASFIALIWTASTVPTHFRLSKVERQAEMHNEKIIKQAEINGYEKALHEILLRK